MKKFILIAILIGIAGGGIAAVMYVRIKPVKVQTSFAGLQPTPPPVKLLTWTDPAGFTFQYPEGLAMNKHDEDQDNYAHIELSKAGEPGSIIVWAKDPPTLLNGNTATDAAGWVKSDKTFLGATALDTSLAGTAAKKLVLSNPVKKVLVGTIMDDTLWIVETTPGTGDFWQKTADTITGSFAFTPASSSASSSDTGEGSGTVDEEEVIQ